MSGQSFLTHVCEELRVIILNVLEFSSEDYGLSLEGLELGGVEIIFLGLLHYHHFHYLLLDTTHMVESSSATMVRRIILDGAIMRLLLKVEILEIICTLLVEILI